MKRALVAVLGVVLASFFAASVLAPVTVAEEGDCNDWRRKGRGSHRR